MNRVYSKKLLVFALVATFVSWSLPIQALAQTSGVDTAGMDRSVDPGNDFFLYANGGWFNKTEIPADRTSLGVFQGIASEVAKRNADLITEAEKASTPEAKMVADYYAAVMDEAKIESLGTTPIKGELAEIATLKDKKALAAFMGSQLRADVDPLNATNFYTDRLFGVWISADFNDPAKNVPYLLQGGLQMPDRDFYTESDEHSKDVQAKYRAHIAAMLKLAGVDDADAKATRIYDLENSIARVHATRDESSDVYKANNPWKTKDFSKTAPGLDWNSYFKAAGLSDQPMIMAWHPNAIKGISALVASQPMDVWKEYLIFHTIERNAGLLPKAFADESFNFNRKELFGARAQPSRQLRAIGATSGALGDVVGKMYVEKYFPPKAKADIEDLVKNIIAAFRARIDRLDWMTAETKAKAKAKVDTLYVGVGYPEHWRSYAGLVIKRDDAFGNAERVGILNYQYSLGKLKQPVDKHEWWMTPQTVNAVNLPLQNAMNFPAAILLPPFFDPNAPAVVNYGGIGSIIGHEISHSFDATGALFDARGRLQNWWTPADKDHFNNSAKMLADQYDAYEALPGLHLKGRQVLDENIADLAGLAAAYDGYRASYGGKEAPAIDGLSGDQQFFVAFGQAHRGKMRDQTLRAIIMTDGHSPDRWRAYTVRNIDAWYNAFDVKPGTAYYLEPNARVKVW
ncbi:MAG TPA: M13 family metallopeptidase [Pyrinomonadaceae bacterium]|nr:M13 family metallopeptidase [Pyrinomonadaceae bacterium]